MRWTPQLDNQLRDMYESNTPAGVIAKLMGRTTTAIHKRAMRLGLTDPERQQRAVKQSGREAQAYDAGRTRRRQGGSVSPPSTLPPIGRAWWLAGWHDMDMEMGYSVLGDRL